MTARLVLGTAQFGLDYGVVNRNRKLSRDAAGAILALAQQGGVDHIDTAPAYGDAEEVLGYYETAGFKIISKVPALDGADARTVVAESGRRSIARIGCKKLHGLLLHAASDLAGPYGNDLYAGLLAARDAGIVDRIGVSVYEPAEVALVLDRYPVDIIQCPFSIVDQRLCESIARMTDVGIAPHVRSVFLQGILLQQPATLPHRFSAITPALAAIHDRAVQSGLTVLEAALAFVRDWPGVEGVVVGVSSVSEFRAVAAAFKQSRSFDVHGLAVQSPDLLDPRKWSAM